MRFVAFIMKSNGMVKYLFHRNKRLKKQTKRTISYNYELSNRFKNRHWHQEIVL